ncbi:4-hydroxy-tetrahydrodipicolinate synthase [Candidatus Ponderosibacter sp. Uisw_141_02]|uniref:4-hydroxy-tetrahydrodipicolinate synthase n=1 Tax=Candidatus Ponderosibacter sp. Uisw_141_02 TaxID=3231000 RepID=UPI003D54EBA3
MSPASTNAVFSGSCTALVTPFKNGHIDKDAFCKLVDWQIENGTAALIPVGTTGESPTLSHEEHDFVVELCIKQTAGRVPVIAGAGSNSTAEAVRLAKTGAAAGADAVLIVSPYYNKPTQEGLYQHFSAVAKAVSLSVIVYDIPGRSIVKVDDATMARLAADHANITGIKDATADVGRPTRLRNLLGADFAQLSGEDATALPYLAAGGHGCISVTANIAPKLLSKMHAAWATGDIATAQSINERLMPLHDSMFCEASPGPVKYAAELLGICSAETRLPLCEIAPASKARVKAALRSAGLLN